MKAQVTVEMLMLFAATLVAISFITQALLHSYDLAQKQNIAVRHLVLVEDDIFMNEVLCNSDIPLPRQIRQPGSIAKMKIEKWVIKVVAADDGTEYEFPGMFVGCTEDAVFI